MISSHTPDLIEINVMDYQHDPVKLDFLGSYAKPDSPVKLKQSTNQAKVNELLQALDSSTCWEQSIFNDPHLPYYAMTAFLENKISREQISHILEFYELKSTYPDIITIPVLNEEGKFTEAAKKIFSSTLPQRYMHKFPEVTYENLGEFERMLGGVNINERNSLVFHILPSVSSQPRYHCLEPLPLSFCELGNVFFPIPARNILFQSITPLGSTLIHATGKLGKFGLNDIENNLRKGRRLQALGYPDAFRTTNTHEYSLSLVAAMDHDALHQCAVSYFPDQLYEMVKRCLDVIRKKTGFEWSVELWTMADLYVVQEIYNMLNLYEEEGSPQLRPGYQRSYGVEESLSPAQCQLWISAFLNVTLAGILLKTIIQQDMIDNRVVWEQWIDVDKFLHGNLLIAFDDELVKPLSMDEIIEAKEISKSLLYGYVANWPVIRESVIGKLIHFAKDEKNFIFAAFFGESILKYSHDDLKSLLTDLHKGNLAGVELIIAASTGDVDSVRKIMEANAFDQFNYINLALKMAAKNGHAACVEAILQDDRVKIDAAIYLQSFEAAAAAGHKQCVVYLLEKMPPDTFEKAFAAAFPLAVKNRRPDVIDLLLAQDKYVIPGATLGKALVAAFRQDDNVLVRKLILYARGKRAFMGIDKECSIYDTLQFSPVKCMPLIIKSYSIFSIPELLYKEMFNVIAKTGNISAAREFIKYINNDFINDNKNTRSGMFFRNDQTDDQNKNKLIMDCMLSGFSELDSKKEYSKKILQPFNLHPDMVKFQIDHYLQASAANHTEREDLGRLINKLFTNEKNTGYDSIMSDSLFGSKASNSIFGEYPSCELPLNYLIHHELIRCNPELHEYCQNLCMERAIRHKEPYYLRLLLKSGMPLNLNNASIEYLPSSQVKCLIWLTQAIDELRKSQPDDSIVSNYIQQAATCNSFENEMFSLVYGNASKIDSSLLAALGGHIDQQPFPNIKKILAERVQFLKSAELQLANVQGQKQNLVNNRPAQ